MGYEANVNPLQFIVTNPAGFVTNRTVPENLSLFSESTLEHWGEDNPQRCQQNDSLNDENHCSRPSNSDSR
jgi:hypothetical protein